MFIIVDKTLELLRRISVLEDHVVEGILKIIPDATFLEMVLWQGGELPRGRRLTQEQLNDWAEELRLTMQDIDRDDRAATTRGVDHAAIDRALKIADSLPRDAHARTPRLTAEAAADRYDSYEEAVVAIHRNRLLRAAQKAELKRRRKIRAIIDTIPPEKRREFKCIVEAISQGMATKNLRVTPKGLQMCELSQDNEMPDLIPSYAVFAQSKKVQVIE